MLVATFKKRHELLLHLYLHQTSNYSGTHYQHRLLGYQVFITLMTHSKAGSFHINTFILSTFVRMTSEPVLLVSVQKVWEDNNYKEDGVYHARQKLERKKSYLTTVPRLHHFCLEANLCILGSTIYFFLLLLLLFLQ